MDVATDRLAAVAERAVRTGGDYLSSQFRSGSVAGEYGIDDVKTEIDRETEARIQEVITDTFPDHAIHGEESGRQGEGAYEWIIDPLDGTNNFASGLPMFASAVAVLHEGDPVVSAIYEPLPDSLYLARDGEGATLNGDPLHAENDRALDYGTVSFVVGLPAVRDPDLREEADRIRTALAARCKRVVETWSPCVDWGLLARGALEGIVCFHPDAYEQHAGELLAAESGVAAWRTDACYVGASDAGRVETLRTIVEEASVSPESS